MVQELDKQYIIDLAYKHFMSKSKLNKILLAYDIYMSDNSENTFNKFSDIKKDSLILLMSFILNMKIKKDFNILIDSETGLFGITILNNKNCKQILTLIFKENSEIIFSYVTGKPEIVKISGTAFFDNPLESFNELKKIIKLTINT